MSYNKIPTYMKILLSMLLGLVVGVLAVAFDFTHFIKMWVSPFGEIFIRLLKMIAVPLVLVSLINGVGGMGDVARLAKMGVRTLVLYVATTVASITLGVILVSIVRPGAVVSSVTSQALYRSFDSSSVSKVASSAAQIEAQSPLKAFVDMVPENMIGAMGNNSAMLQIILIAAMIGISVILVGQETSKPFRDFISSLDKIVIKLIEIVMSFAPYGVFALITNMVLDSAGDGSLLGALGLYMMTVIGGLLAMMLIVYPLIIKFFTKIDPWHFVKSMFPVQMLGFTTSSSAATLATTMETSNKVLGLPESVTSFTLPVGVTINMDGTSIYQAIAVVFIAQVMGIDLTLSQLLIIIATTTLSSIGTPGVPGGSIVVTMMVLSTVGIPAEGLALIMGVDRPLDMLRTSVNVTGDVAVSALVAESLEK
ncbi:MAG: dicarboxylate/amino acid:cation symporter [Rikenellaceae bacterium]